MRIHTEQHLQNFKQTFFFKKVTNDVITLQGMSACGVYQIDFENPFMPFKEKYPEILPLWRDWQFVAMPLLCCYTCPCDLPIIVF